MTNPRCWTVPKRVLPLLTPGVKLNPKATVVHSWVFGRMLRVLLLGLCACGTSLRIPIYHTVRLYRVVKKILRYEKIVPAYFSLLHGESDRPARGRNPHRTFTGVRFLSPNSIADPDVVVKIRESGAGNSLQTPFSQRGEMASGSFLRESLDFFFLPFLLLFFFSFFFLFSQRGTK